MRFDIFSLRAFYFWDAQMLAAEPLADEACL